MKVNKNLQPVSIPIEPHNQYIKMTPKEALDRIAILSEILVDVSKFHIMPNDGINEIRKLDVAEIYFLLREQIKELEELKRDVARFMELMDKYMTFVFLCDEETNDEYDKLSKKLMKVGK